MNGMRPDELAEGIRRFGFRKWYERQLLRSHGHLAGSFLCLVGVFAAFEALTRFRDWSDQVVDLLAIALCVAAGLWSLRRYLFLLGHAEMAAGQADCPQCGEYGRLLLKERPDRDAPVHVACKKCGHDWHIDVASD